MADPYGPPRALRWALGAALGGALLGLALHLALAGGHPALKLPTLYGQAVWAPGVRPAPGFVLRDGDGRAVSLRAERAHVVLLAFMSPSCPAGCPLESEALTLADAELAPAERPLLLVVSLAPGGSAAAARATARRFGWRDWDWLFGSRAQLARVWQSYGVEPGGDAAAGVVFVIDRRGDERAAVSSPFLPQFLADTLRVLARGS